MQPIIPASDVDQDQLNKSIGKVLLGNVSPGSGLTFDANNQPLTYAVDNTVGRIIRIGSTSNPHSLEYFWPGNNADLTINHVLNAVPYGYIVIAKDKTCDVYWGSVIATDTTITLRNTDATADTTIWLLA